MESSLKSKLNSLSKIQITFIKNHPCTKLQKNTFKVRNGVRNLMNAIVSIFGVLFLGLISLGVYNVVIRKKKVENMYTPFDDATQGIKDDSGTR